MIRLRDERAEVLQRLRGIEWVLYRHARNLTERRSVELERTKEKFLRRLDELNGRIKQTEGEVSYLVKTREGWVEA